MHRDLTCPLPTVQTCPLNLSLGFLDHLRNAWSFCCVPGVVLGAGLSSSGGSKVYRCRGQQLAGEGCLYLPHVVDSVDSWMLLAASEGSLYDDFFSRQLLVCTELGLEPRASACMFCPTSSAGKMGVTLRIPLPSAFNLRQHRATLFKCPRLQNHGSSKPLFRSYLVLFAPQK